MIKIAFLLLSSFSLNAAEKESTLQQILDMAKLGPEVKSADFSALEAKAQSDSVFRKIYVPKLEAGFNYQRMLTNQAIQVPQLLTLPLDKNSKSGSLGVSQVIFDPANMLYNFKASEHLSEASNLNALRQIKNTQNKVIELALQSLELRAKKKALEKFTFNLKKRLNEIQRIYELGGLGESDVLKIKLGIDDANQGIRDYQRGEEYLAGMIAALLGENRPIIPTDLPEELPLPQGLIEKANVANREDIQAIDKQLAAVDLSHSGKKAEYLPKVYGYYQHVYNDNALLKKSNFDVIGIQASWSLFDGGVSFAEANANAYQKQSLESKRSLAISAYETDVMDAIAALRIKRQEYEERRKNVLQANSVSESEFRRLKTGKSTVNNLIDAEEILKDRTEKESLSKISWYQAWFKYKHASGEELIAP